MNSKDSTSSLSPAMDHYLKEITKNFSDEVKLPKSIAKNRYLQPDRTEMNFIENYSPHRLPNNINLTRTNTVENIHG